MLQITEERWHCYLQSRALKFSFSSVLYKHPLRLKAVKVRVIHREDWMELWHVSDSLLVVGVVTPFEPNMYVPVGAFVRVNCTVNSNQPNPVWLVHLAGTDTAIQFTFSASISLLNSRGFYLLSGLEDNGRVKTTRLLINDTAGENGTTIECIDASTANVYHGTRLYIYGENT